MAEDTLAADAYAVAERIKRATNAHDLDALVDCFYDDYESAWPVHPARTFVGTEQVRRNWGQIFASVPDLRTEILSSVVSGDQAWTEWEFAGHRTDGAPFLMRGVVIIHARGDRAAHARFYLEPVDAEPDDQDAAVRRLVGDASASSAS
jgi:ketosteroid isomerase-like protein